MQMCYLGDINTKTGERIIVFTLKKNLKDNFKGQRLRKD